MLGRIVGELAGGGTPAASQGIVAGQVATQGVGSPITTPLNSSGSVRLDANGNGIVALGPQGSAVWALTVAAVSTSTSVKVPQCSVYMGTSAVPANLVDGTFTGNLDSTDRVSGWPLLPGQQVWAVWSGGDAGATATLSIIGTERTG